MHSRTLHCTAKNTQNKNTLTALNVAYNNVSTSEAVVFVLAKIGVFAVHAGKQLIYNVQIRVYRHRRA